MPKLAITHISNDDIEKLIVSMKGNLAQVARKLEVSRSWVHGKISQDKHLQEVWQDAKEEMLDNAESVLYKKVLDGQDVPLIFFLKTQGHKRGYGRQDNDPEASKSKIILVDRDGVLRVAQDDGS